MTEQDAPRRLLVLAGPADHQIAVSELPESGELVVDDLTEATRIGDLNGDAQPLVLTIDGERYVIVGGSGPGGDPWDRVEIRSPGPSPRLAFTQMCRVRNDVWLSFPEPFRAGMELTSRSARATRCCSNASPGRLRRTPSSRCSDPAGRATHRWSRTPFMQRRERLGPGMAPSKASLPSAGECAPPTPRSGWSQLRIQANAGA